MSVRLLILGLLRQGPLHGYEIKRIIGTEMADWNHVAVGSIYFALARLSSDALIEERETTREGGRPERTVYAITRKGRTEFERLLRENFSEVERPVFALDIGVAFMDAIPDAELRSLLERRVGLLESILSRLSAHRSDALGDAMVPARARYIFAHHERHYRAELKWTKELLADLGDDSP
jgi:DNA-binding PadR family transcriptional regulator